MACFVAFYFQVCPSSLINTKRLMLDSAIICQMHLLQVPHSSEESQRSAFNAASTILSIMETLQSHKELQYSPSFM